MVEKVIENEGERKKINIFNTYQQRARRLPAQIFSNMKWYYLSYNCLGFKSEPQFGN